MGQTSRVGKPENSVQCMQMEGKTVCPNPRMNSHFKIVSELVTTCRESAEREAKRRERGSIYALACNGRSSAPRIKSHKIAAGSPNVNGMFANRLTIFT